MKQAIHTLQNDIRRLWLPLLVVLLLLALHAIFDILRSPITTPENARINQTAGFLGLLLTLAWWYLIAAAIYGEVLPGDRQFWITRPYSRKSLLGAKVLFVLLFVNVPLLISDCFILGTQGFPVLSSVPALVLRQLPFSFLFILGAFVLGTLTSGIAQFVLAWFLLFLGIIAESFFWQRGAGAGLNIPGAEDSVWQWIQFALVIAIAVGVVVWQYATRRTWAGRAAFAASIFVIVPAISIIPKSPQRAFMMYSSAAKQQVDFSRIRIRYDPGNFSCSGLSPVSPAFSSIALPLQIDGLPPGAALLGNTETQISAPVANTLQDGSKYYSSLQRTANSYCLPINFENSKFRRLQSEPLSLNTSLYLTAVNDQPTVTAKPSAGVIAIPNVGFCETHGGLTEDFLLSCRSGVRSPEAARVHLENLNFRSEPVQIGNFSAFRLITGVSPVEKWSISLLSRNTSPAQISAALRQPEARLVFIVERPLGYGIKELRAENINLERYVVTGREGLQ